MKVKSESEVTQSCLTLSDPMDYSLPCSSVHGILQARVLQWGPIAFSGYRVKTQLIITKAIIIIKIGWLKKSSKFQPYQSVNDEENMQKN